MEFHCQVNLNIPNKMEAMTECDDGNENFMYNETMATCFTRVWNASSMSKYRSSGHLNLPSGAGEPIQKKNKKEISLYAPMVLYIGKMSFRHVVTRPVHQIFFRLWAGLVVFY